MGCQSGQDAGVNLKEPKTSLDFLGYTFRFDRDRHGGAFRYLNLEPSAKALAREREALRQMTGPDQSHTPLPELIAGINRHLKGWGKYFNLGYPRKARRRINAFVRERLRYHLQRPEPTGLSATGDSQFLGTSQSDGSHYPVNAQGESLHESRMRESRTSGSTRGGAVPSGAPRLLYRSFAV